MKCEVVGWHSVQIEQWRRANTHIEQHSASEEEPSHMLSSSTVGEPTRMSNKFILSCQAHHSQSEERKNQGPVSYILSCGDGQMSKYE